MKRNIIIAILVVTALALGAYGHREHSRAGTAQHHLVATSHTLKQTKLSLAGEKAENSSLSDQVETCQLGIEIGRHIFKANTATLNAVRSTFLTSYYLAEGLKDLNAAQRIATSHGYADGVDLWDDCESAAVNS